MSFWDNVKDNVKKITQPYSDEEEYDDYDDEEELDLYEEEEEISEPAPRSGRRPSPFATSSSGTDFAIPSATATAPAASTASSERSGFSGQVLNMSSHSKQEVVLFHLKKFGDSTKAADELKNRKAVILNMENVDSGLTRRSVDFLSGCAYALGGNVKKIAMSTYLFCPNGMAITGDLENIAPEVEGYI